MKALPASLLLAAAACSPSPPLSSPDAGSLVRRGDASPGGSSDARPSRTVTTRPLLGTSPTNLLLDPFVTGDGSWGHFVGVLVPGARDGRAGGLGSVNASRVTLPHRAYLSQSPAGVAVPVVVVAALASSAPSARSLQFVAPFPGGSDAFDAQIWISAGDAAGEPVAFDTVASHVTVALLPNDQPSSTFPLAPSSAPPLVLAGRSWVTLSLPTPAPVPQGGWFSITLHDANVSLQIQAPEVTPTGEGGPHLRPLVVERTEREMAAPEAYVEMLGRGP